MNPVIDVYKRQVQGYSVSVESALGCGSTFTIHIPPDAIVG